MLKALLQSMSHGHSVVSRHRCVWTSGSRPFFAATSSLSANASVSAASLLANRRQPSQQPPSSSLHASSARWQRDPSLGLWKNLTSIRHGPVPALLLGVAGLAPFALVPVSMIASGCYDGQLVATQTVYGATVLAFLGGVRWGSTLPDCSPVKPSWFNLTTSVMPPLLAWAALLLPQPWPLPAVLCSLLGVLYADLQLPDYPSWFRGLRLLLTSVAVICLALSAVCWLALPLEKGHKLTISPSVTTATAPEVVVQNNSHTTQTGPE